MGKIIAIIVIIYILYKLFFGGDKKADNSGQKSAPKKTPAAQVKAQAPKSRTQQSRGKSSGGGQNRWRGQSTATPHDKEMPTDGTEQDARNYVNYLLTINDLLPATGGNRTTFRQKGFPQYISQKVTELWDDANLVKFGEDDSISRIEFHVAADAVILLLKTSDGVWFTNSDLFSSRREMFDKIAAAHPELPIGLSFPKLTSRAQVKWLGEMIAEEAAKVPALKQAPGSGSGLTYFVIGSKCGQMAAAKEAERKKQEAERRAEARRQADAHISGGPKSAPGKDAPKGGSLEEQIAAMMGKQDGAKPPESPKPDSKKPEPPKPAPTPKKPDPDPAQEQALISRIATYYTSMWDKQGSLYKELDSSMPIDHFAIQLKGDRVVDSVWLSGDEVPLVSETAYTDLPGESLVAELTSGQLKGAYASVTRTLTSLGTLTYDKDADLFYPVHKGKPQEPPKPESTAGKEGKKPMSDLEAQMQAMLDGKKK